MIVAAIGVALVVVVGGGYLVGTLTSRGPAPTVSNSQPQAVQELPSWVQRYITPATAPTFKVDEFIRSLSYAPVVKTENLPSWVQNYMTPTQTSQFKVDEFIQNLSYAPVVKTENLPSWVQKYITPTPTPQFKVDEFIESLSYGAR